MICNWRLINGSKLLVDPSNEQKRRTEGVGGLWSCMWFYDVYEGDCLGTIYKTLVLKRPDDSAAHWSENGAVLHRLPEKREDDCVKKGMTA